MYDVKSLKGLRQRPLPHRSTSAMALALGAFAAAAAAAPTHAVAGPKGGTVVAGQADITTRGSQTTIRQGTDKVVIDWRSFDIDAGEAVQFLQPGDSSIALNRVLDNLPTHIRGTLLANANVWIVNQSGIVFHAGSMVDVGGLIATTSDISNADFLAGNYRFDKPGNPDAKIINEGSITFGQAGLAAFVAPGVENRGVIAGKMGKVVIAGAETFAVDLAGDGMWAFTMGEGGAGVRAKNTGRVHNPGGYILISAAAAQGMVDSQISVGGVVEATSAEVKNGKIVLSGDGHVEVSGTLDATGAEAGAIGGGIEITGETVHLTASARLDVSGDAGGGSIKVGGDYQGGGDVKTASRTLVADGAQINASTIGEVGQGGEVIVWADERTGFFGSITARGGSAGGDGGFAEVSGKEDLLFAGIVDLGAPGGDIGRLLLDPDNITIVAAGADDAELDNNLILFDDGGAVDFTLSAGVLDASMADVTLQAANDITVDADVTMTTALVLEAGNDIVLNADLTALDLTLTADADFGGGLAADGIGTIDFSGGGMLSAGVVSLQAGEGIAIGDVTATTSLDVLSGGAISQIGGGLMITGTTVLEADGTAILDNGANSFGGAVTVTEADSAQIFAAGALEIAGITAVDPMPATSIVRSYGGDITLSGDLDLGPDGVALIQGNAITQTGGGITADYAIFSAMGIGDLSGTNNITRARIAANDAFTLSNEGALVLDTTVATDLTITAKGDISQATGRSIQADSAAFTAQNGMTDYAIALTTPGNNFVAGGISATGGDITINDTNALVLDDVVASGALTVTAGGAITQNAMTAVEASGLTSFTGYGGGVDQAITLDQTGNDFAGGIDATGSDITIADSGALTLGAISASGALTVTAGGALTDTDGQNIDVTGVTGLTVAAGADVTLDNVSHDFGGQVTFGGTPGDVVLNDANTLTVGAITTADPATNTIALGALDEIVITGTIRAADTTLTSILNEDIYWGVAGADGLLLTDASTDFIDGQVTISTTGQIAVNTVTRVGDTVIEAAGADGLVFEGTASSFDATLTVNASGDVIQTAGLSVTELTGIDATGFDVILNNVVNDFGDAVSVSGEVISLADIGDLRLGEVTATGTLTALAGGVGTLDQTGDAVVVTNETTLTAGADITLSTADNSFTGVIDAAGNDITLINSRQTTLGAVTAAGGLSVTSEGAIVDTAGQSIAVVGTTSLTASSGGTYFDIALDNDTAADRHDFGGAVSATGQDIILTDVDDLQVGTIRTNGGGAVDSTITGNDGDLALTARGGAIATAMDGDVAVGGLGSFVAQDEAGITSYNISLDADANQFGAEGVTFDGQAIIIRSDSTDITAFDSRATGTVTLSSDANVVVDRLNAAGQQVLVTAAGAGAAPEVSDITAGTLIVNGGGDASSETAVGGTIAINRFELDGLRAFSDAEIALTNGDAGGELTLTAPTQRLTAVTADAFNGATDFNVLTGSTADLLVLERLTFAGDFTASAGEIRFAFLNATNFAALNLIASTGDVAKRADADIDFGAADDTGFVIGGARGGADTIVMVDSFDRFLAVEGDTSFTANAGNVIATRAFDGANAVEVDFGGQVSVAAGNVAAIEDVNDIELGSVNVMVDLAVRSNTDNSAGGTDGISQNVFGSVVVGGTTSLITGEHDGTLNDAALADIDVGNADSMLNTVSVIGRDVSITEGSGFTLAGSAVAGELTLGQPGARVAGGLTIVDTQIGGRLAFDAAGDVTLSRVAVADGGLDGVSDGDVIASDLIVATGDAMIVAGGELAIDRFALQDFDLDAGGSLALLNGNLGDGLAGASVAVGDVTLGNVTLGTGGFEAGTVLTVDAVRADALSLSGDGAVMLGTVAVDGDLSVASAAGAITALTDGDEAPTDVTIAAPSGGDLGFDSSALVGSGGMADVSNLRVNDSIADGAGRVLARADFDRMLAVGGATGLDAGADITLPREAGGLHNELTGTVTIASDAGDVVLETAGALGLGTVTAADSLTLRSNSDNAAGEGNAAITQSGALVVAGDAAFITGDHGQAAIADARLTSDVELDNAGNSFGGTVSVIGENATIRQGAGDLALADSRLVDALAVSAAGALTVSDVVANSADMTAEGDVGIARISLAAGLVAESGGDISATDLVAGQSALTAVQDLTIARADLGPATVNAGATARLSDVVTRAISVDAGGAVIAGLSGDDAEVTVADDASLTQIEVDSLTITSAAGDVSVEDALVADAAEVDAGGAISIDQFAMTALRATGNGEVAVRNGEADQVILRGEDAIDLANLRTGRLTVNAADGLSIDAVRVERDATLRARGGEIALGGLEVGGALAARANQGSITTAETDLTLTAVAVDGQVGFTIAGAGEAQIGTVIGGGDPTRVTEGVTAMDGVVVEDGNVAILAGGAFDGPLVVDGAANLDAGGDVFVVAGTQGANRFGGGVNAAAGGAIDIATGNELVIGADLSAAFPASAINEPGLTAGSSIRVEADGTITDADGAVITGAADALFIADGDLILDNETHDIAGGVGLRGDDVSFAEIGSVTLGRVRAGGDLRIEAGANGATAGGTTGDAAITQGGPLMITVADMTGEGTPTSAGGPITVDGDAIFTTGLNADLALSDVTPGADRDLRLTNQRNVFGGDLSVSRVAGRADIAEESTAETANTDDRDGGTLRVRNFEIGGSSALTTSDDVIFVGRLTALDDSVGNPDRLARPGDAEARAQGDLALADDDLRLFIATGETLTIDTTGNGAVPEGGFVRFDRPVDGDNDAPPVGSADIGSERAGLGGLVIMAGTDGEVRFRDFVGATNPLGAVDVTGGDFLTGFTFETALPNTTGPDFSPTNRFLFDPAAPDDFFFAGDLTVDVGGTILAATPPGQVDFFILNDAYFGVNVASLSFGDTRTPDMIEAFGFIQNTRQRAGGLFPQGPQSPDFEFNDCVIGDVTDCSNVPTPNIINQVLIVRPTVLGVDESELLEIFGSFGNEELWGVPQSFFSDLIGSPEDCEEDDATCEDG